MTVETAFAIFVMIPATRVIENASIVRKGLKNRQVLDVVCNVERSVSNHIENAISVI